MPYPLTDREKMFLPRVLTIALLVLGFCSQAAYAGAPLMLAPKGGTLEWARVERATEYRLGYKTVAGKWPGFQHIVGNVTAFTPEEAHFGGPTEFRVQAYGPVQGEWSNVVMINYPLRKSGSEYLQRCESTKICAEGKAKRLIGYNDAWAGPACGGASASSLDTTFAHIAANSKANIVRAGMFQTYASGSLSFAASDRYVEYAKKYGLKLVPVLADEWGQCENPGGSKPKRKYLSWYQGGFLGPESLQNGTGSTQPLSFKKYAETFARHYANEPTIAFYQLINEPDGLSSDQTCSEPSAKVALRNFSDAVTEAIKLGDPHHMVDLGDPQFCGVNGTDYAYVAGGKSDLCDAYHDYTKEVMPTWIKHRLEGCVGTDKKPAFAGEAGLCAFLNSANNCVTPTTATTLQNRANLFKAKLQAGLGSGLVGYIIWSTGKSCSGAELSNQFVVGANNVTGCPVPEVDPTETAMASFG